VSARRDLWVTILGAIVFAGALLALGYAAVR
jgi:hypothetical protein